MPDRICQLEDCDATHFGRGWCSKHYDAWRRTLAERPRRPTPEERFWSKVEKTDTCWLWLGQTSEDGYAIFSVKSLPVRAHRIAYLWRHGDIPGGLSLDHLCRVRRCVNPDHLEPVTTRENLLRGDTLAALNAAKTHCDAGHPFNAENTYRLPDGRGRACKACKRLEKVRRRARTATAGIATLS